MPKLLEIERAIAAGVLGDDAAAATRHLIADGLDPEARLQICRNTFFDKAGTALRLSYPAVHRLVGTEFFEGAARIFIAHEPPRTADLDAYGEGFADFLAGFPPANGVPYLADVARLEWAVAQAVHAPDFEPLDPRRLVAIDAGAQDGIAFIANPAVRLVAVEYPVDAIRRAVLAADNLAMAAVALDGGPLRLLVERRPDGVEVIRLAEPEWRFTAALFASKPLAEAIAAAPGVDPAPALAEHFVAGRFVDFLLPEGGSERG